MKTISPREFKSLSDYDKLDWQPVYVGYNTKKEREYSECEECGNRKFQGWVEHHYPIGKPLHYKYKKASAGERVGYGMIKNFVENHDKTSWVKEDVSGDTVTINFNRYTDA